MCVIKNTVPGLRLNVPLTSYLNFDPSISLFYFFFNFIEKKIGIPHCVDLGHIAWYFDFHIVK